VRIAIAAVVTAAFFLGWLPASWSMALLFTLSVLSPRPRRNRRQSRPGYIRPSLNAYVNVSPTTVTTPMPTGTFTEFSVPPDIRETFTAGHEALADRIKTGSLTGYISGTESNHGAPTTAVNPTWWSAPPCGCGDTPEAA
jgi:hypothetical protein